MNKKLVIVSASALALLMPFVSMAIPAPTTPGGGGFNLLLLVNRILDLLWILFIAFAVIMFVVAGFMFLTARGEPEAVKDARNFVIYGIVGVAVGVIAFSLPFLIQGQLGA